MGTVVAVVVVVAAFGGSYLLADSLVRVVHGITGGNRTADTAAGFLVLWVPVALISGILYVSGKRRGRRTRDLWALLLLVIPITFLPYNRFRNRAALQRHIDVSLPGFYLGLLVGALLAVGLPLILGLVVQLRGKSTGR